MKNNFNNLFSYEDTYSEETGIISFTDCVLLQDLGGLSKEEAITEIVVDVLHNQLRVWYLIGEDIEENVTYPLQITVDTSQAIKPYWEN